MAATSARTDRCDRPAVLGHDQRLADMAAGGNVSESTVRRWRDALITLLAAQAPGLDRALKKVVLNNGTLIPASGAPNEPTGGTTPANTAITDCTSSPLTDKQGRLIWISAARPGRAQGRLRESFGG
ncbi:hypothetical protein [Streptomyces sp. SID161]|uniref:hypothetical protein n=1 Tax=Streptomyces sp. SID161 TaxID=2690251 RepID=UPI001928F4A8|nr:hypothetical protein [Streptomyces sp. SID161]